MNKRREVFWRLLRLLVSDYKGWLSISLIAIILSALSGVAGSLFIQRLIDHYIMPLTRATNPDFKPLLVAIGVMAAIFYVGVIATVIYSQIMAVIGQRIQESIRDQMFEKMQVLPLRYFDQND
ncbi:MAG TPA: ABC transporter, partial [Lactobacillus sp.]|nr:ABC transporter [Lactobacillus sp.]